MEQNYFFNDTADLRKYIPVTEAFVFAEIKSFLESASIKYLRNDLGIGKQLFDEILGQYNIGYDGLSDIKKTLLHKIRRTVAHFAMSHYINYGMINIGKDGANLMKNENREQLKKWQKDGFEKEAFRQGFEMLDQCIEWLEENKASFSTWTASAAYTLTKENFINSVSEFTMQYPLVRGRRTFLALKPTLQLVQDIEIKAVLGETLFDEMKTAIAAGNLSTEQKGYLALIQPAIAHMVMSSALPNLCISINDSGIQVLSQESTSDNMMVATPVSDKKLDQLIDDANQKATTYLNQLRKLLEPTYTGPSGSRENDSDSKIYYA